MLNGACRKWIKTTTNKQRQGNLLVCLISSGAPFTAERVRNVHANPQFIERGRNLFLSHSFILFFSSLSLSPPADRGDKNATEKYSYFFLFLHFSATNCCAHMKRKWYIPWQSISITVGPCFPGWALKVLFKFIPHWLDSCFPSIKFTGSLTDISHQILILQVIIRIKSWHPGTWE